MLFAKFLLFVISSPRHFRMYDSESDLKFENKAIKIDGTAPFFLGHRKISYFFLKMRVCMWFFFFFCSLDLLVWIRSNYMVVNVIFLFYIICCNFGCKKENITSFQWIVAKNKMPTHSTNAEIHLKCWKMNAFYSRKIFKTLQLPQPLKFSIAPILINLNSYFILS